MGAGSREQDNGAPRWRYLALAALVFIVAGALLAFVWQVPRLLPGLFSPTAGPLPSATLTASPLPPTRTLVPPTPTTGVLEPTITDHSAVVDDQAGAITFYLAAEVPHDREIVDVLLWYDTEAGHSVQHLVSPLSNTVTLSYHLDAVGEGLTRTVTTTHELDYWWLVRDTAGDSARLGGTVTLGPNLWSMVTTPTPEPPPIDFTWTVSESQHFQFHYMSGTAAERDRFQLGALAEASLDEIRSVLDVEFTGQMSIYLVPRVFWQGGAAYGEKVQLISYLDRNYTGVEIWSYFTHEGTHALAQDLLEPKENGGGPDGVLVEGLAVWASNGHYRREPIDAWAAVIAASDEYLPLADLRAGPFYDFQHETSYLEGASFVKFLVERYGLDRLKELYGQATSDQEHDEALVERLYGKGYDVLESEWLGYLAGLDPTLQQAETWRLNVRSFDLMRHYETELDPDARLLPPPPTEWTSDTLKVFLGRVSAPVNVVLETALIAAQERIYGGDLAGATALLDDVESALDAGGAMTRPSLTARQAILDLMAAQDQAILRADAEAYRDTLEPASILALDAAVEDTLAPPLTAYDQEMVSLDLSDDQASAEGAVLVHAKVAEGEFPEDGQVFAVTFVQVGDRWLMTSRVAANPILTLPPANVD
jgi:hypothetical protein